MRYDAAIIGAGAEGLAAATVLGQAGLRVVVIERGERAGGRLLAREFHPGFRCSPFVDGAAAIPASLFWTLDLARRGAFSAPQRASFAVWPDRRHALSFDEADGATAKVLAEAATRRREIAAQVLEAEPPSRPLFGRAAGRSWPGEDWSSRALEEVLAPLPLDAREHLAALALAGTAADPFVDGSALHLLGAGGLHAGGTERLAAALIEAAKAAGAEFSFGLEASDLQRRDGRITGIGLADGSEIVARGVISTLDLKRTFLTFFAWNSLPRAVVQRVNAFRVAGSTARVLFALDRLPPNAGDETFHAAPSLTRRSEASQAWRSGILAEHLPVTLNVLTARDPELAPPSCAVVAATLSATPFRLFDGAWTREKREHLRRRALDAAELVWPGFGDTVVGAEVVAPPDIEDALGATDGDLNGGEIAADQMLGGEPWSAEALPRTPIAGLYLAGSYLTAGAFATCAAGAAAAKTLLADHARGRLR
ncbi:MAG TPA: FAD-dependent oxidoreductase [Rhizomicrobium sp.]|nr:FAD-dependent oxidoreductase [Rhizomicrobium sp.]